MRPVLTVAIALATVGLACSPSDAQPVNIYRYLVGRDIPLPASFEALQGPGWVLDRGSAPRPYMVSGGLVSGPGGKPSGLVAIDVCPYWLFGGGVRPLERYRANSIPGRLMRVLTKTAMSFDLDNSGTRQRVGFGLRTTIHDPHDAVLNSQLPEEVSSLMQPNQEAPPDDDALLETPEISQTLRREADAMRRRRGVQVSLGYAVALQADSTARELSGLTDVRHSLAATGQVTAGGRYDILLRLRSQFAARSGPRPGVAVGLLRKSVFGDVLAGLWVEKGMTGPQPLLGSSLRVATHVVIHSELLGQGRGLSALGGPIAGSVSVQIFPAADRP